MGHKRWKQQKGLVQTFTILANCLQDRHLHRMFFLFDMDHANTAIGYRNGNGLAHILNFSKATSSPLVKIPSANLHPTSVHSLFNFSL